MATPSVGNRPLITKRTRLGDFTIPAAGGRGIIEIDSAKNIHAVELYFTAVGVGATYAEMIADLGAIRVRVGGQLIVDLTATELLDLYHFYNDANGVAAFVEAGVLPIRFTPYMLPLSDQTQEYAIGMLADDNPSKRNTFTVEVNMLTPGGGLTVDACEVHLETDELPAQKIGYHMRWLPYGTTWPAATAQTLDQITHEPNALAIVSYHIHHAAGTLARIRHVVNDEEVISDTPLDLNNFKLHEASRSPVALYESIDFNLANHPLGFRDISRLVNERLTLTWGVLPGGYTVIRQELCKNLR